MVAVMTQFIEMLEHVANFLNQNDLVSLGQVSKKINETVATPRL